MNSNIRLVQGVDLGFLEGDGVGWGGLGWVGLVFKKCWSSFFRLTKLIFRDLLKYKKEVFCPVFFARTFLVLNDQFFHPHLIIISGRIFI